jgi:hypothetical protein
MSIINSRSFRMVKVCPDLLLSPFDLGLWSSLPAINDNTASLVSAYQYRRPFAHNLLSKLPNIIKIHNVQRECLRPVGGRRRSPPRICISMSQSGKTPSLMLGLVQPQLLVENSTCTSYFTYSISGGKCPRIWNVRGLLSISHTKISQHSVKSWVCKPQVAGLR